MNNDPLIPHLFRSEYSKIVAVICKTFGLSNIQLAEDITSKTFLKASETWGLKGVPANPKAWLYTVAKNITKDHFKREKIFNQKIVPELKQKGNASFPTEIDLSDNHINDSLLQMLFTICNPMISKEAQLSFALRVLCGFGIKEISTALLTSKSTINKRLTRTKETFRKNKIKLKFPTQNELIHRLDNVLSILYLLFNEGYYSSSSEKTIQKELCFDAMRLLHMLLHYPPSNLPQTNALMALFCFHTSRFEARIDHNGAPVLYEDQDQNKWNLDLIQKGEYYLAMASSGNKISTYHLEASIAYWHTKIGIDSKEKWENILQLYNKLLQIKYSPVIALNRTYALSKARNKHIAIEQALKIDLQKNHLYHTLLADLYHGIDNQKEKHHLQIALKLADTENDRLVILGKIRNLHS